MRGGPGAVSASPHRSVTFNHPTTTKAGVKDLERRVREAEERKNEAEKAVKEAEAAAAAVEKKDESKVVAITA
jgi:nuclear polyadenylated RNA-binding protein NAB2